MRKLKDRLRAQDGQALVELAFVLPLVLLLLFGVIDFGLALHDYNGDTNIANLAARTASVIGNGPNPSCGGNVETTLTAYVDCEAAATGAPTPSYVCVADTAQASPSGTFAVGDPLEVKVSSTFGWAKILTGGDGYIGRLNPTSTLTASATMRVEQAPSAPGPSGFLTPLCSA